MRTSGRFISIMFGFALVAVGLVAMPSVATAAPVFEMPFPCGEQWQGATYLDDPTYGNHGGEGNYFPLDFNRSSGEYGAAVVASAPGTVYNFDTTAGLYVVVDHGGGWTTRYLHLSRNNVVSTGKGVERGVKIGEVGDTGAASSHLHYEQRYGTSGSVARQGAPVHIAFSGVKIGAAGSQDPGYAFWYNGPTYTSRNCQGGNDPEEDVNIEVEVSPSSGNTHTDFQIEVTGATRHGDVEVRIYDPSGSRVYRRTLEADSSGEVTLTWDWDSGDELGRYKAKAYNRTGDYDSDYDYFTVEEEEVNVCVNVSPSTGFTHTNFWIEISGATPRGDVEVRVYDPSGSRIMDRTYTADSDGEVTVYWHWHSGDGYGRYKAKAYNRTGDYDSDYDYFTIRS